MTNSNTNIPKRRKREQRTDYDKRLKLLKSGKPRLVVRPSLKNITVQVAVFNPEGDIITDGVHSHSLEDYGWSLPKSNIPSAYLTGYLLGMKTEEDDLVLDTGRETPVKGDRIYACVKGVVDAGVSVSVNSKMFPSEERINGEHIEEYVSQAPDDHFTSYEEAGVEAEEMSTFFNEVKSNIEEEEKV